MSTLSQCSPKKRKLLCETEFKCGKIDMEPKTSQLTVHKGTSSLDSMPTVSHDQEIIQM